MIRAAIFFALLAGLAAPSLRAAEPPPSPAVARLAELCNVWGHIKYLHPSLWTRDIDWDAALLAALPKVRAATSEDEYAAAVDGMLRALGDPTTRVVKGSALAVAQPEKTSAAATEWIAPELLLVRPSGGVPTSLAEELAKARRLVVDLRVADEGARWTMAPAVDALVSLLAYRELRTPVWRYVRHDGYRGQSPGGTGAYATTLVEEGGRVIPATPGARRLRVAFLVNAASGVPEGALALQATGDAVIIAHGARFDDLHIATEWPLGAAHHVEVRMRELLPGATIAPHADAELPAGAPNAAVLAAARARLAAPPAKPGRPAPPGMLRWRAEKTYGTDKNLDVDHRLLALFRLWNVIDSFYPYKELLDDKWDDVLTAFIPRVIAAEGAKAYVEVMAELATHVADAHTRLRGGEAELGFAGAMFGLRARMIERQPVVVTVDDATAALGVRPGDVILAIDGEPMSARLARLRRVVPGGNDAVRDLFTLLSALGGSDGSTATVRFRDGKGGEREVTLTRKSGRFAALPWRSGEVVRILDGNIGYVDLDRLPTAAVPGLFAQLAKTRAIVFDMRGYPRGTLWDIAPRLNVKKAPIGAEFERLEVSVQSWGLARRQLFQPIAPAPEASLYRGKTFLLVDERTISQAEHAGIFFRAAAGIQIVGSQTAGANGDVTNVTLPGGLDLLFTGQAVRHADGRQLQRVGLPIDVRVTPTIAGIRAGRDEVLERALELARK